MIKVLSLFDGISGARQALKELSIECKYYASEIDKFAIQVAKNNHLDIIQIGDVNDIDFKQIKDVDLLIAGFPCQDLSIAKRDGKGLEGARSGLFSKCLEALEICKPKYFLFENVNSMKKEWKDKISELLEVEPIMINSALLTAQMRKRLYWTNIPNIQQPQDKGIVLKDIIESGDTERLKSYCIPATYSRACPEDYFNHGQRQLIFKKPIRVGHFNKGGQGDRIYSVDGKSVCLSANGGGRGAKTGLYEFKANNGKRVEVDLLKDFYAFREVRTEEGKRKRAEFRKLTGLDSTKRGPGDKKFIPKNDGKANCLTTGLGIEGVIKIKEMVRKLTPIECERLQGFPDNYSEGISNTQRYKALGNSFTVPIIKHILQNINGK
jgi:DNA (cytosine-5)-methyltransferase 3A